MRAPEARAITGVSKSVLLITISARTLGSAAAWYRILARPVANEVQVSTLFLGASRYRDVASYAALHRDGGVDFEVDRELPAVTELLA